MFYKLNDNHSFSEIPMQEYLDRLTDLPVVVRQTHIKEMFVSTVFLSLSCDRDNPTLFETMIFHSKNPDLEKCYRYRTYQEAVDWHEKICEQLK